MTEREAAVVIDLPINWNTLPCWRIVSAEIVEVAPHLANIASFAVHKNPDQTWRGEWEVSNIETGFRVCYGDSREEAIKNATQVCATKSVQQVVAALERAKAIIRKDIRRQAALHRTRGRKG